MGMLTPTEAAKVTGLSVGEIRRGIKEGIYPHMAIGEKQVRFLLDEELLREAIRELSFKNKKPKEEAEPKQYGLRKVI